MSEKLYQDFRRQRQIPLTVLGGQPPYQTRLIQDAATCHRKDSGSKSNTKRQYSGLPETAAIRKSTSCQDYKL